MSDEGPSAGVHVITPYRAKWLLAKNKNNRAMRPGRVRQMAADMIHGRWREDLCPPIILGPDYEVIDGQHRLMALVTANKPFCFEVRRVKESSGYGLPIDVGLNRSPRDLLLRTAKVAQVVNTIAMIATNTTTPSRDDLVMWDSVIGDMAARLQASYGGDVRVMSTAPVRAGFCLSAVTVARDMGEGAVFAAYADLKAARLEASHLGSLGAAYRRLLSGRLGVGIVGTTARCWVVTEAFRRRDAALIRCPSSAAMGEELRGLIRKIDPRHELGGE